MKVYVRGKNVEEDGRIRVRRKWIYDIIEFDQVSNKFGIIWDEKINEIEIKEREKESEKYLKYINITYHIFVRKQFPLNYTKIWPIS